MAKIQVIVSPYLVSKDELSDAAKAIADELLEVADADPRPGRANVTADAASPDGIRAAMDLPTWVGIPAELIHAIRCEILERTMRPAPTRRLGDYCPS